MISNFITFFISSDQLFLFDLKLDMFPLKMCNPTCTIGHGKIIPPYFEYPECMLNHFGDIDNGMIGAHQRINGRFVNNQIKRLIWIGHLCDIHDIIGHSLHFILFLTLQHLLDHHLRNIIVHYIMIPVIVKILLDATVTTTDIQNY